MEKSPINRRKILHVTKTRRPGSTRIHRGPNTNSEEEEFENQVRNGPEHKTKRELPDVNELEKGDHVTITYKREQIFRKDLDTNSGGEGSKKDDRQMETIL
ncbi:hypothetical protein WA026_006076 [Henosepilachna vigintioctopunctata]|uniref:Uncharacterized protein n=1 Tax=Henosepilachna vigintioctopunctata TaxID=420089 RepID=A0AAW1TNT7_9CUCU